MKDFDMSSKGDHSDHMIDHRKGCVKDGQKQESNC